MSNKMRICILSCRQSTLNLLKSVKSLSRAASDDQTSGEAAAESDRHSLLGVIISRNLVTRDSARPAHNLGREKLVLAGTVPS